MNSTTKKMALRLLSLTTVALGVAAAVATTTGSASAKELSNECVSPKAKKRFNECPGGRKLTKTTNATRGVSFTGALPGEEKPKKIKPKKAVPFDATQYRDNRKSRLQARVLRLLMSEIQGLERLYKNTPRNAPDRLNLLRRLAETYVELEQSALNEKNVNEIKVQDARRKRRKNSVAKAKAVKAARAVKIARKYAVKYYKRIIIDYPNYGKLDEVLYYLAYEYEQAKALKAARKVYLKLIKDRPKSKYVPNALLAFGELFYNDALTNPSKWKFAAAYYEKVTKYPPPDNKVYGYASYKLAYTYWNMEEYKKAIDAFKKVIEYGKKFPQMADAAQITKSARRDLITVYAQVGLPERAYGFFKPLSGDKGGSNDKTFAMLDKLGEAYFDSGHFPETIVLYKDLKRRDRGDRSCKYQGWITQATQAIKSSDKDAIEKALKNQLSERNRYRKSNASAKQKFKCDNETAALLAETAISWHIEAVGAGDRKKDRGTSDPKTMAAAARLYDTIVENYKADEFAKYKFPRLAKKSWPSIYRIKYYRAELLWVNKDWEKCGPAFDAVVEENPTGPEAPGAAYAAVLCYQKMYEKMYAKGSDRETRGLGPSEQGRDDGDKKSDWEKFKPKKLSKMQDGMLTAFNRYVCYIKPKDSDEDAMDDYVRVKYARARTYYEAQHWEEAALAFRDIALNHSKHDSGVYAAMLYLESLNVLGIHHDPPRAACYSDMEGDVGTFLKLYCSSADKRDRNLEQCNLLDAVQFDILRLKAQKMVELADKEQKAGNIEAAIQNYREGAGSYQALWERYCYDAMIEERKTPKRCKKADEIVYNIAKAYQAGRLLGKSITWRMKFLRYGRVNDTFKKSDLTEDVMFELGGNWQAVASYANAATWYERYAKAAGYKGDKAANALSDAVVLRLGLGQDKKALSDAQTFAAKFRGKQQQAARIAFAVAAFYAEKNDWAAAHRRLRKSMRLIDRAATPDVKLQAHALFARAYKKIKQGRMATTQYRRVIRMWGNPAKAIKAIQESGGSMRDVGRAMEAVGEAYFEVAEIARDKVLRVKFPEYKGPGDMKAVDKHVKSKVVPWAKRKDKLIKAAAKEYAKILKICVGTPIAKQLFGRDDICGPPRWIIASGARVGQLYGDFVSEFRSAPIPDMIKRDYGLRGAYYSALDGVSEPWKKQAKAAFETCLGYSTSFQYFDEFSRSCEEWLYENYKAEFTLIDEFRGSPNKANTALQEQPRPLTLKGQPIVRATNAEDEKKAAEAKEKAAEEKDGKK